MADECRRVRNRRVVGVDDRAGVQRRDVCEIAEEFRDAPERHGEADLRADGQHRPEAVAVEGVPYVEHVDAAGGFDPVPRAVSTEYSLTSVPITSPRVWK